MKIIKNKLIPVKGFFALNFYNLIFVRHDRWEYYEKNYPQFITEMKTHESIHTAQMRDFCIFLLLGGTVFYLIYLCEWVYRLFQYQFNNAVAYHAISFEKEAREHELDQHYLQERKRFAQWKRS